MFNACPKTHRLNFVINTADAFRWKMGLEMQNNKLLNIQEKLTNQTKPRFTLPPGGCT